MIKRSSDRLLILTLICFIIVLLSTNSAAALEQKKFCDIWWGSQSLSNLSSYSSGSVDGIRVGQHPCFERLVFDLGGSAPGYYVEYQEQAFGPGKGLPVNVAGGAKLKIIIQAPAHDQDFNQTLEPDSLPALSSFRTLRDVEVAGSFEGQTHVGLGVRARLPFRVFTLDGPGDGSRLVVDVAHRW